VALGVGKNVVSFIRHWCTAGTIERIRKRGDEIVPGSARTQEETNSSIWA
jgi:hypothetical protein